MPRCGKSYVLFKLFYEALLAEGVPADAIIRLDLGLTEHDRLRSALPLIAFVKAHLQHKPAYSWHYLLIDEVQLAERAALVLNSLQILEGLDIYVTGRDPRGLTTHTITEFRGRSEELKLYPVSFPEYLQLCEEHPELVPAHDRPGDKRELLLRDYLTYGALPQVLLTEQIRDKSALLQTLLKEQCLNALKERGRLNGTRKLKQVLMVAAQSVGQLLNPLRIKELLRESHSAAALSVNTIKQYLELLEQEGWLIQVARYNLKRRHLTGSPFKYYFEDTGLCHALGGLAQNEQGLAALLENAVYLELCRRGYQVQVGVLPHRSMNSAGRRIHEGLEIDFVVNSVGRQCYVQTVWDIGGDTEHSPARQPLLGTDDYYPRFIVSADPLRVGQDSLGINYLSLMKFLTQPQCLGL